MIAVLFGLFAAITNGAQAVINKGLTARYPARQLIGALYVTNCLILLPFAPFSTWTWSAWIVVLHLVSVEIAAKATELAARQYDQQKARFDAGLSTSRVVLQFQDDLENARIAELQSKLALRRAVAELRRLEGTSLQRFKLPTE